MTEEGPVPTADGLTVATPHAATVAVMAVVVPDGVLLPVAQPVPYLH